jgi:hypothetical protein|tara:strand:- start:2673 stop:3689 length:1017 start_codon:yes stop_codon:yes gene_type:complete
MIVINMMMRSYFYIIILLVAFSCMEPNTESLWQLNKIVEIDTEGYCRDVYVSGDSVFLATGQAGIQLWDISNITSPILVWKKTLSDLGVNKEISQVEYKPSIKQLFALESNERPIHIDLSKSDSVNILGQFSSEKTKEFRISTNDINSFTVYAADNDDGLKLSTFEYDTLYNLWFNTSGNEVSLIGNPNGLDLFSDLIILTLDQLGVQVLQNNNNTINYLFHEDLPGNSRAITITKEDEFYVACEEAGAFKLETNYSDFTVSKVQFGKDLYVTHVTVLDDQIVLSCAGNGLSLYEKINNDDIQPRGIHNIGYVYHAEFYNNYLFAASREGLQIFQIDE